MDLINRDLQAFRAQIDEIVKDLHDLTIRIGNEELANTLSDLRNRLHEPFMFVIVGEVKAGKSSFINALLGTGEEVAKVAPQPMTDTIQQILYGEEEEEIVINKYLKKVLRPVDILKEIAIVDTPGTNTIVEHHQEVTESFIPASDLIVFVFEAKNPYRQSAWEFLRFIHADWRKKIIFVLQQKDLMSSEDLAVNLKGVEEQARKQGLAEPIVFATSAKEELEGKTKESGFTAVRAYISENITGGKAPFLKLQNNIETSRNINRRIADGLADRRKQWQADLEFRQDISGTLEAQQIKSTKQVDGLVQNLLMVYDRITDRKLRELRQGLSFFTLFRRAFVSLFSKKESPQQWLEGLLRDMEEELNREMKAKLDEGVVDLAESIQQMARIIDLKIRNSTTILKNDHEIFSDIAERRNNVMQELQDTFTRFINRTDSFTDDALLPDTSSLSPNIVSGSGIAAVGIILAAVTNATVFDITGGILTAIGLLFAGFSTRSKRKKIVDEFEREIVQGRERISREVSDKLKAYIENLAGKIEGNFKKFDELIEREETQLKSLSERQADIESRLEALEKRTAGED